VAETLGAVNDEPPGLRLVVSVHDVSPATATETAGWCADADALGIPVSLLVIPGPWRGRRLMDEPEYADVLRGRVAGGDEIVLHGWSHQAGREGGRVRRAVGRAVARGAAEFAALREEQATERLSAAGAVLADLGLTTCGFTPPGWLASPAAERAVALAGFAYTTTHFGVRDLRNGRLHRGLALSHRPGGGLGERLGAAVVRLGAQRAVRLGAQRAVRLGAQRAVARRRLVRIALHPDDRHRPGLRDTTMRAIEAVLGAGGRALTYGAVVAASAGTR
jgi:uncharacterized protein